MVQIQAKDQKPFTEQFVRSQHRVYGYIVTLLPDRNDADDAFQETCLVLWDRWSEFDQSRDFVRWACGIAHNVVRNYWRTKNKATISLSEGLLEEIAKERIVSEPLFDTRSRALKTCLEKLPTQQRKLLEQCYSGEQEIQSVAEGWSLTRAAVYLRLQRIRRTLFECADRALRAGGAP